MNKIEIGLNKGYVVIDDIDINAANRQVVAKINYQLMQYGYILDEESFMSLSKIDEAAIITWGNIAIQYYSKYLGDAEYKTLSELILDGDLFDSHMSLLSKFWLTQEWEINTSKDFSFEIKSLKVLSYLNEFKFKELFTTLISVNTALTPNDFEIIEWFIDNYKDSIEMPDSIPFKENLCMLAGKDINVPVNTSTDVLRIAAYMSGLGSDLILPAKKIKESGWSDTWIDNPEYKKHKFRNFKNSEKRYLLGLLEKVVYVSELKIHEGRWIRLFHMLNPQKYTKLFPKVGKAANLLRNQSTHKQLSESSLKRGYTRNKRVKSWEGRLASAYNESFLNGLKMHKERPGEFARSLDNLLRNNTMYFKDILREFKDSAIKISNKVLFELYTHFNSRNEDTTRSVFIKGARRPVILPKLSPMSLDIIEDIQNTIFEVLFNKFKLLKPLGKVWLDEEMKKIPLPTNMRTLQDSLTPVIRGTRVPFGKDIKIINAYIYWTAGIDLDLSVIFINIKTGKTDLCSYRRLCPFQGVQHSGDIIPKVDGKYAEYISIDIEEVVKQYDYALMTVHNYRGGPLSNVGAITGIQEVFELKESLTWLPENAEVSLIMQSEASTTALLLLDLVNMEYILIDIDLSQLPRADGKEFSDYILSLTEDPKVSVYQLLKMHAEARGSVVADELDADIIYCYKDFVKDYTNIIKYML